MSRVTTWLTAFWLTACAGATAWGQPPGSVAASEPAPVVTHLVGHEDTALLKRVEEVLGDWDPRTLRDPYLDTIPAENGRRTVVRRRDLLQFIADPEAARALGKAFFWEIRAGSDYRRDADGAFRGMACASCHYRFGADARNRNTARIPYVAWDRFPADPNHPLPQFPFDPRDGASQDFDAGQNGTPLQLIVGSSGVAPRLFEGLADPPPATGAWLSEESSDAVPSVNPPPNEWEMFLAGGQVFRQITHRNTPTAFNAAFSDRLFHDGRAESTFNGFSIFGDRDRRAVIHKRDRLGQIVPVHVAVTHAALASQAVGPIVNDVEMSYGGRAFPDVARKLLDAPVLAHQAVAADDSVLGTMAAAGLVGKDAPADKRLTYRALIRLAFRREWWDGRDAKGQEQAVPLELSEHLPNGLPPSGTLEEANFPLYWGLGLMLYQSGLISNESPFDAMLRGDGGPVNAAWQSHKNEVGEVHLDVATLPPSGKQTPTPPPLLDTGTAVFQRGMRVFLARGCVECHAGPFLSEIYDRLEPQDPADPIHFTMKNLLLPNARADAVGLKYQAFQQETFRAVAALLRPSEATPRLVGERLALALDHLRAAARGRSGELETLVGERLAQGDPIAQVAALLLSYERNAPTHAGGRAFFDENARVAAAEQLTIPVFVESMLIPDAQMPFRPRLPIGGLPASQGYAFYDLGFYNLGVSPPRYDRGIGGLQQADDTALREHEEEAVARAVVAGAANEPAATPEVQAARDAAAKLSRPQVRALERGLVTGSDLAEIPLNPDAKQALKEEYGSRLDSDDTPRQESAEATLRARGQAYRIRPEWLRDPALGRKSAADGAEAPAPNAPPEALAPPAPPFVDHSWDRDYLPREGRRSEQAFLSRARELVVNEENWGHRKPFLHDDELAFWGAFRTPSLRNVALTPPYMHNGRLLTLRQVIEFYDDGGHVPLSREENPDKHPAMVPLDLSEDDKRALHFFLICLTDDRVRHERAPFDHPSLPLVSGYDPPPAPGQPLPERVVEIPAIGAGGRTTAPSTFPSSE